MGFVFYLMIGAALFGLTLLEQRLNP